MEIEENLATEKQINYIRGLGGYAPPTLSKRQTSALINQLLSGPRPVSQRQLLVLRFWNRLDLKTKSREEVSDWIDQHYANDVRHQQAWERYKSRNGDNGGQDTPMTVPLGAGYDFMKHASSAGGLPPVRATPFEEPEDNSAARLVMSKFLAGVSG